MKKDKEDLEKEIQEDIEDNEDSKEDEEKIEIDTSKIGNLAQKFKPTTLTDTTLQPVAETKENAPANLERSVEDVWTGENKKEEKPEYQLSYDDIQKSYDDSKASNITNNPNMTITRMENIDMNPVNLGRDWSPVQMRSISNEMINPELRELRKGQGNLERDYVVGNPKDEIKEFKTHSPFEQRKTEYEIK